MNRFRCCVTIACALMSIVAGTLSRSAAKSDKSASQPDVPGSAADSHLQADIRAALDRLEGNARPDCALRVQAAESCPIGQSVRYARMSEDEKKSLERALRQDLLHVETWHATSCGEPVDYEVLLLRSPQGGTDIMAERLETGQPAPDGAETGAPVATPTVADPAMPAGFETYQGLKEQFTIELPEGWHVVDQNAAMGRLGPYGVVVFSAVETGAAKQFKPDEEDAIVANLRKVSTGEISSFIIERSPSQKRGTCAGYDKKALNKAVQTFTGPAVLGAGAKVVGDPTSEVASIGGCAGVKVTVHYKSQEGVPRSMLAYTVTDGHTNFIIGLRAEDAYFESTLPIFERAVASLRLASAK